MRKIYLDYNATTPILPEIQAEMADKMGFLPLNPSSVHDYGRTAYDILEDARIGILKAIFPKNFDLYNLIFTSCATESNNIAVNSFAGRKVAYFALDHASVRLPAQNFCNSIEIKPEKNGRLDIDALEYFIAKEAPDLLCVVHASSELGVIQDIAKIAKIARKNGVKFHTDSSQSFGKIDIDFDSILPDIITVSSHKIYGPPGIAGLIYKKGTKIQPMMYGGAQEGNFRPGSHNVPGIYGFFLACRMAIQDFPRQMSRVADLRDSIDRKAHALGYLTLCSDLPRIPNTTMICKPSSNSSAEIMRLDMMGVMASSGSACSSGLHMPSKALEFLNIPSQFRDCSLRFSLGINTAPEDIEYLIGIL